MIEQPHKILFVKKKNTAHAVQAKDFVGVKRRQNDRVCCGAVNLFMGNKASLCRILLRTQWDF